MKHFSLKSERCPKRLKPFKPKKGFGDTPKRMIGELPVLFLPPKVRQIYDMIKDGNQS